MTIPWEHYYYPHLRDEETENQKNQVDAQVILIHDISSI